MWQEVEKSANEMAYSEIYEDSNNSKIKPEKKKTPLTTMEREKRPYKNKEEEHSDVLARLFDKKWKNKENSDVCVSLLTCELYEKNKIVYKLLLASNKNSPENAIEYLKYLRKFIDIARFSSNKKELKESYEMLVREAFQQVFFLVSLDGDNSFKSSISSPKTKYEELKVKLKDKFGFDSTSSSIDTEWIKEAQSLTEQLWREEIQRELLLPLIDTNIIVNSIIKKELDSKIIELLSSGGNIKSIENIFNRKETFPNSKRPKTITYHAEMKVIQTVLEENKENNSGYIGISKLCCVPCYLLINVLNSSNGNNFTVRGTHGCTYFNWGAPPNICSEELLKKFEDAKCSTKGKKKREKSLTTSDFLSFIESKDVYNLIEKEQNERPEEVIFSLLSSERFEAIIEVPPKQN